MRLLNARTLKLHSFQEEEAPEYAILSHTWHDDEVLFEDLRDMAQASKQAGFTKIRFCCDQALKDEIQFIWVDTCCIDKASSAELSEAINSMFRWYRNAKVCYAYLQDVLNREHGDRKMRQSRWFKRAWTLQELLAPSRLVFYSNNWTTLGTKDDVKVIVSRATGIDEEYLTERPLEMASIAKRMSWASKREATRAEDIAYSLFGVFDVQMPLLYGEGLRKAFMRLQEEIMKSSNDHTLFAWTRPSGPNSYSETSSVLAPSPDCFADSSNLVPTEKINPLSPYTMTNMGLRIFLPLSHDFNGVTAALNCHIEYDYFHVVTLPLLHLGSNQFVR
ncbi:HET-domain-containing protein, partial [Stipitochalara longipes BDJ]